MEMLAPEQHLPLVISPNFEGLDIITWAGDHREDLKIRLHSHGAILFRGFKVRNVSVFEEFLKTISGELLGYPYQSTPRTRISGNIYTSTEYPAEESIPLHNELAYSNRWPLKLGFFCSEPAERGGETPLADSRKVYERIPQEIKDRFIAEKILYVRNYSDGLDLPWQTVFQSTDKVKVEDYCHSNGIEFEWREGGGLRTRQICQAVARHPYTGDLIWFNQAHLFHISSLNPSARQNLRSILREDELPRNAYYGDGAPIEDSVLECIRRAYQQETVLFPWRQNDLMVLDNMLTAHGRRPYVGPRRVLVGMAEHYGP